MGLTAVLVGLNLVLLNVWSYTLQGLRVDLTQQQEFSLSQTTRDLLASLQEPLVMRAYISDKTHPLLEPLKPRIADMLREYAVASAGRITADVVDPASDPAIEAEANQTYGIEPTPLQVSGRYEASLINSYFDILVRYGDQNAVLNFRDLIEVQPNRDGTLDVRLRNLEYDLTRSIKKVLFSPDSYYLDMILQLGDQTRILSPGSEISEASVRSAVESALKRSSTGFLKVVGLWTPPATPTTNISLKRAGASTESSSLRRKKLGGEQCRGSAKKNT